MRFLSVPALCTIDNDGYTDDVSALSGGKVGAIPNELRRLHLNSVDDLFPFGVSCRLDDSRHGDDEVQKRASVHHSRFWVPDALRRTFRNILFHKDFA